MSEEPVGKVDFEWALEGKPPGSPDDYQILSCGGSLLSERHFEEIRNRNAAGTSTELPQVRIALALGTSRDLLVVAIQDWSPHRDGAGRKIAHTRWFYVPYDQLARERTSYEALYDAFADKELPWPEAAPRTVPITPLDADDLAGRAGPTAVGTAALLVTGRPVCVLGAGGVELRDRLRFLDTVAALLPYGIRARLTAATWTSSTSGHKMRLSFSRYAPDGAYPVTWDQPVTIPPGERGAQLYVRLMAERGRDPQVVNRLAAQTDTLALSTESSDRLLVLVEQAGSPPVKAAGRRRRPNEAAAQNGVSPGAYPASAPTRDHRLPSVGTLTQELLIAKSEDKVLAIVSDLQGATALSPGNRWILRRAMESNACFSGVFHRIGSQVWAETRLEELTRAAFYAEDLLSPTVTQFAREMLVRGDTPQAVRAELRRIARWTDDETVPDQDGPAPPHPPPIRAWFKPTWVRLSAAVAAGVLVGAGVAFLAGSGGDAPGGATGGTLTNVPATPAIAVQTLKDERAAFATEALTTTFATKGWPFTPKTVAAAEPPPGGRTPTIVVTYDLDALTALKPGTTATRRDDVQRELRTALRSRPGGYELIATPLTVSDTIVYRGGDTEAKLRAAFAKTPKDPPAVAVEEGPDAATQSASLQKRYPMFQVSLDRNLEQSLAAKSQPAAIIPADAPLPEGYKRADFASSKMAQRTLVMLVSGNVGGKARATVEGIAGQVSAKRLDQALDGDYAATVNQVVNDAADGTAPGTELVTASPTAGAFIDRWALPGAAGLGVVLLLTLFLRLYRRE